LAPEPLSNVIEFPPPSLRSTLKSPVREKIERTEHEGVAGDSVGTRSAGAAGLGLLGRGRGERHEERGEGVSRRDLGGDLGDDVVRLRYSHRRKPGESLVDEGVALVKLYGEKPSRETVNQTAESVVRYRWMYGRGTEGPRDNCVILYHRRRNTD
jgi:hypothetical protein